MTDIDDLFGPPLGECGRCHRKTWAPSEVGHEDRMTQPDGFPCGGTVQPIGTEAGPPATETT